MAKDKETNSETSAKIRKAFMEYIRVNGQRPRSYAVLITALQVDSEDARTCFRNLSSLERAVWMSWFEETLAILSSSPEYKNYTAREKLLSLYYTWIDTIKPFRSYIKTAPALPQLLSGVDRFLLDIQRTFVNHSIELIRSAIVNEEIVKRPFIQNHYEKVLWQQFLFIMNYWLKDKSEEQSKTDEAIERSVNLFFELAGHNPMDSILDFGKFLLRKG